MKLLMSMFGVLSASVVWAAADGDGWKLVWSDEFNGTGLPDPTKWSYEEGFVRNKELQYYTRARKENARVENGHLIIEARKEPWNPKPNVSAAYTVASLKTDGLFSLEFGRVEVRAKLPAGRGAWPAIWMLGTNIHAIGWPRCGEIDIMEFVGHDPGTVHATVHWFDPTKGKHASRGGKLPKQSPSDDFHVYAMEWSPEAIHFFYDGHCYFKYAVATAGASDANPFLKPHYLLMNLAIGGSWGGQKGVDEAIFPQRYIIDYVRVFQRAGRPAGKEIR